MIRCEGCGRHVRAADASCPFCDLSARRSRTAHRALQWMGGISTTVVLAACYGGPDIKGWDSGYKPTSGTPTGTGTGTPAGTATGTGSDPLEFSVVWTDDGGAPSDADGNGQMDTNCSADTVDVSIHDPLGIQNWLMGMAEAGPLGWTGEDCYTGGGGFNHCHPVLASGTQLIEVCTPIEVVEGQTTLLDFSKDPYLAYYFEDSIGTCLVWGTDVAYYDSLGCTQI